MQLSLTFALFFAVLVSVANGKTFTLSQILERLKNELNYESLLLLQNFKDDCWSDFQKDINTPIFNLNNGQNYQLKRHFNKRILALVCLKSDDEVAKNNALMKTIYQTLDGIRSTPVLFLVKPNANLSAIFEKCFYHKMLNVVALKRSEGRQRLDQIYSYEAFPHLQIIQRRLSDIRAIYEPKVKNLFHYPIVAWPVNVLPRAVFHKDPEGNIQIKGYIAQLLKIFAGNLNASLQFVLDTNMPTDEMITTLLNNGSFDFCVHLTVPTNKMFTYSRFVQISHYRLMVPEEPLMERAKLYFSPKSFICEICLQILFALLLSNTQRIEAGKNFTLSFFNQFLDPVLRGFLSQPFVLPKRQSRRLVFIYWLLIFSGLFNTNLYIANLTMLFLNPPATHRVVSFQDIRGANHKILFHALDYRALKNYSNELLLHEYKDIVITTDAEKFQRLRNELNPLYTYPITDTLWPLLKQKQIKLDRPIFRISEEITFNYFLILIMPIAKNSIFEVSFNRFVSHTHCSGLFNYWFERTFNEMLEIGKITYSHRDINESFQQIHLNDLFMIYLSYMVKIALSLIVFAYELLYYKWTRN